MKQQQDNVNGHVVMTVRSLKSICADIEKQSCTDGVGFKGHQMQEQKMKSFLESSNTHWNSYAHKFYQSVEREQYLHWIGLLIDCYSRSILRFATTKLSHLTIERQMKDELKICGMVDSTLYLVTEGISKFFNATQLINHDKSPCDMSSIIVKVDTLRKSYKEILNMKHDAEKRLMIHNGKKQAFSYELALKAIEQLTTDEQRLKFWYLILDDFNQVGISDDPINGTPFDEHCIREIQILKTKMGLPLSNVDDLSGPTTMASHHSEPNSTEQLPNTNESSVQLQAQSRNYADDKLITMDELCTILPYSKSTLYKYTSRREIPFAKHGKKLFFKYGDIVSWIERGRVRTIQEITRDVSDNSMSQRRKHK